MRAPVSKASPQKLAGPPGLVVFNKHVDLATQVHAQAVESAKEISRRADYYAIVRPDGVTDSTIEDGLRDIESLLPRFSAALRTSGTKLSRGDLGSIAAIASIWEARSRRTIDALEILYEQNIAKARADYHSTGLTAAALEAALAAYVRHHFDPTLAPNMAPTAAN